MTDEPKFVFLQLFKVNLTGFMFAKKKKTSTYDADKKILMWTEKK